MWETTSNVHGTPTVCGVHRWVTNIVQCIKCIILLLNKMYLSWTDFGWHEATNVCLVFRHVHVIKHQVVITTWMLAWTLFTSRKLVITITQIWHECSKRKLQQISGGRRRDSDWHHHLITERSAGTGVGHLTDGLPDNHSTEDQATLTGCHYSFSHSCISSLDTWKSLLGVAAG